MYVIITGASRGIGLELTRLAAIKGHHILAISRKANESIELNVLKRSYPHLSLLDIDLQHPNASLDILKAVDHWPVVDVLMNNAGVYLGDDSLEDFEKSFLTNTIQPFFITRALSQKLKKSKRPVSLQVTSQMGSIEDNTSGGSSSYRASKAALNMLYKGFSITEKSIISLLVHPGWVQTRMGGNAAPVTPEDSAAGIWKIAHEATLAQSGTYLTYLGKSLPW